jgi:hypothetical protein
MLIAPNHVVTIQIYYIIKKAAIVTDIGIFVEGEIEKSDQRIKTPLRLDASKACGTLSLPLDDNKKY